MKQKLDVLDTAAHLVAEEGADAFTINRLAQATGVSRSTIYRRWGGRDDILRALTERGVAIEPVQSTRSRVLAAVGTLIGQQGKVGATIAEIAAAAEVSAVTVFRLFGDRETLLRSFLAQLPRGTADTPARAAPLREALETLASENIAHVRAYPGLHRIACGPALGDDAALQELQSRAAELRAAAVEFFEARLAAGDLRGGDAHVAAAYWLAALEAEGFTLPSLGEDSTAEEGAERATDTFLRAFSAPPPDAFGN